MFHISHHLFQPLAPVKAVQVGLSVLLKVCGLLWFKNIDIVVTNHWQVSNGVLSSFLFIFIFKFGFYCPAYDAETCDLLQDLDATA